MNIKSFLLFVLFSVLMNFTSGFSQNNPDSLLGLLRNSDAKSEIYNLLAERFLEDSTELSHTYAVLALTFADKETNEPQKAKALFNFAEVFVYQYQPDSAKKYYSRALPIFRQIRDRFNTSYTLNNLGWIEYEYGNYREALDFYLESLNLIDESEHANEKANILLNIGNIYHQLGSYYTAIEYFHEAEAISRYSEDKTALPVTWNGIGLAYKYLANYDSALFYYQKLLKYDKTIGTQREIAIDYQNIGSLYYDWKQYHLAEKYYLTAWQIYKEFGNKNDLSVILNNLGKIAYARKDFPKAIDFYQQALDIDLETGIQNNIAIRYNNLGDVFYEMKEDKKALHLYESALEINEDLDQKYNISLNLKNLGNIHIRAGDYELAGQLLDKGYDIAVGIKSGNLILLMLESRARLAKARGEYAEALDFYTRYSTLKDSIFTSQNQQVMADMHTKYELDEKEQQIEFLNQQKELETLQTKTYRKYLIHLGIGIIIISVLLIFLFRQYLLKNRAYQKLVRQNIALLDGNHKNLILNGADINSYHSVDNIEAKLKSLQKKFVTYLITENAFLREDLNINEVAKDLDTNAHYISEVVNKMFSNNFNGLINEYRVKEACRLLSNPDNNNLTIESIARQSGFKSKSVFNQAFKSVTGVTPSFFKNSALKS